LPAHILSALSRQKGRSPGAIDRRRRRGLCAAAAMAFALIGIKSLRFRGSLPRLPAAEVDDS